MDLINQFIENYKKKINFYETAARIAEDLLGDALRSSGIRAMVTSRAKSPARLKAKVSQRNDERESPYKNMSEIYADIADLSGVRVSLYFPGDRAKAEQVINNLFSVYDTRKFPAQSRQPSFHKRFSGYWATHYRIGIPEERLEKGQKKYSPVRIEIQVASVLMHAWSEVEHDLVYKPLQGAISEEELSILDELNGLVLTGEIALERLQKAGDARLQSKNASFQNQYDLAAYLYNYLHTRYGKQDLEPRMGNVELLLRLLTRLKAANARELEPILKAARISGDKRTVSEQLIDQIIYGNEKRYLLYLELSPLRTQSEEQQQACDYFLKPWISLETVLGRLLSKNNPKARGPFNINSLKRMKILGRENLERLASLRNARNGLIHGTEMPSSAALIRMGADVRHILSELADN